LDLIDEVKRLNKEIESLKKDMAAIKERKKIKEDAILDEIRRMKKHLQETTGYIGVPERKYRGEDKASKWQQEPKK